MVACPHARHLPRRETYAARRSPLPCAAAEEDRSLGNNVRPCLGDFVVISATPTDRLGGVGLSVELVDPGAQGVQSRGERTQKEACSGTENTESAARSYQRERRPNPHTPGAPTHAEFAPFWEANVSWSVVSP